MINRFLRYLLKKNITPIHGCFQYSFNNTPCRLNGNGLIISREILCVPQGIPNHKYAEKIEFGNQCQRAAVAVGYNPALCSFSKMDKTNCLVSDLLFRNGYDGYYLFNMFPEIQIAKIQKSQSAYPDYIDMVLDFLIADSGVCRDDIFIFWGSSVYINRNVEQQLNNLQSLRTIYTIGTQTVSHKHPGRGVTLQTIGFHPANLSRIIKGSRYLK